MRVKVCGITRYEDARLAAELGAWGLGFIFWPSSKRSISKEGALAILERLAKESLLPPKRVGVFVNSPKAEILDVAESLSLTTVQLHGEEDSDFVADIPYETIKAFRPRCLEDLEQMKGFDADYFLVDSFVPGAYGGTGKVADWRLAKKAKEYGRLLLSGGLTPLNIGEARKTVDCFAYDLASGVEVSPGVKDHGLLRELFARANS